MKKETKIKRQIATQAKIMNMTKQLFMREFSIDKYPVDKIDELINACYNVSKIFFSNQHIQNDNSKNIEQD